MEDTAGAPPTCRAISLGLLASCTLRSPTPSGHRTLPCEAAVPRPQTEHLVSSSPQNPTKFTVGPQDLSTLLSQPLRPRRSREARAPPRMSSLAGWDARLPFLLLVSCHCRCGPLRCRALGLPSRWGCSRCLRCGPGPLPEDPVDVKGARKPESPTQVEVCGRLARYRRKGWRKVTGRNLHREAGSGTGVGGGCQMPKGGQRERDRSSFSPQNVVTFFGVQK